MVEWGGLENRCTLAGTVGSNPTPSASYSRFRTAQTVVGVPGFVPGRIHEASLSMADNGLGEAVINFGNGDGVTLAGVSTSSLVAGDFIF